MRDLFNQALLPSAGVSTKNPIRRSDNEFYRYYAGYPLDFATWALSELGLPSSAVIVDPWSGSGTTAAACAHAGTSCYGYDINPVMVHLGRARVALDTDFEEAAEIISNTKDLLRCRGVTEFREIGHAFREIPVTNETAHSVAIAALFPFARSQLEQWRSRNPSWYSRHSTFEGLQVEAGAVCDNWIKLLKTLKQWRSVSEKSPGCAIVIERGDSRKAIGRFNTFDGVLTSPPYLTRLDYVHATLPEFLLLRDFDLAPDIQRLRRSMLGSPLTSERPAQSIERLPDDVRGVLERIKRHASKASSTYYLRFFATYFVDLQASIRNIGNALKSGGSGCIVAQPTSYKDITIDLPDLIASLANQFGLFEYSRYTFDSRRSMSLVNTRAHANARLPKAESAVFFRKE
ncbi:site-specific DNA-methyltransferase [Fulvimarina endophytica]|uniref:site-specific DNA-methyltransferase (cytosine-N(4)-specific) n=1 Tax=Fulvimarina endophytica TaxID=2293836 RepID=A0A371X287_9HYPH|nr:site-specific DNA-methyltransferase [Fulvimarina endophytica]RFC63338.1 site-specific DNA-methyltransferase [Fulvimarina endophytica]